MDPRTEKGCVTQGHVSDGEAQVFIGADGPSEMGVSECDVWPDLVFPKTLYSFPYVMNSNDYYLQLSCFLIAFLPTNTF